MADNLGELIVSVSADISKLQEGLTAAGVLTEQTAAKTDASTALIAGLWVAAAAAVVTALGAMAKASIDYGDEILKASEKTGLTTESLSKLKYAADQSNVSFDAVVNGLKFLERSMFNAEEGNAKLSLAFAELGINIKDANGNMKSAEDVLLEAADKFKNMESETAKTALAMQIFGRAGTEMLPLLNEGSEAIKKMEDTAKSLGLELSGENAKQLKEYEDNLKNVKAAFGGLSLEITNDLYPALDGFIKKITDGISGIRTLIAELKSGDLIKGFMQDIGAAQAAPLGQETDSGRASDVANGYPQLAIQQDAQAQIKAVQDVAAAKAKAAAAEEAQFEASKNHLLQQQTSYQEFATSVVKAGASIQGGFTTALSALILHGGTAKEIFTALGQTLVQSLVDFVAEQLIAHSVGQVIKAAEAAAITAFGGAAAASLAPAAAFMEIITLGGATGPATAGLTSTVLAANGLAGFAEGTDTVPAMLSPGEMVVPSTFAGALRAGDLTLSGPSNKANPQGSEGDTVNVNVSAVITYPVDIDAVAKQIAFLTNRELRYLRPR